MMNDCAICENKNVPTYDFKPQVELLESDGEFYGSTCLQCTEEQRKRYKVAEQRELWKKTFGILPNWEI